jgi:hypothetical protein
MNGRTYMKKLLLSLLLALLAGAAFAPAAEAQIRNVQAAPQGWFSVSAGRYLDMGQVADPESGSTWIFGEAFTLGVGYHRDLGPGLSLGGIVTGAMPNYQRVIAPGVRVDGGRATLLTPMVTGRLNTGGGGGGVAFYLTGGAGAFIYRLPDLDRWDPDLALFTGAGLDYAPGGNRAFFVEWGRFWVYHQGEGIESNRAFHSLIRAGMRVGR